MTITAKYQSQCPHCGRTIRPGEQVDWVRGAPAVHVACANGRRAGDSRDARTVSAQPASRGGNAYANARLHSRELDGRVYSAREQADRDDWMGGNRSLD